MTITVLDERPVMTLGFYWTIAWCLQVLVVAGGYAGKYDEISSTEMLIMGTNAWTSAAPLPTGIWGFASTSLNNKIYFIGWWFFLFELIELNFFLQLEMKIPRKLLCWDLMEKSGQRLRRRDTTEWTAMPVGIRPLLLTSINLDLMSFAIENNSKIWLLNWFQSS